jgi:hypothetical protein
MRFRWLCTACVSSVLPAAAFALACATQIQAAPSAVTGTWQLSLPEFNRSPRIQLVQQGNTLSGKFLPVIGGELPLTGTIEADRVNFTVDFRSVVNRLPRKVSPDQAQAVFVGTVSGGMMRGTAKVPEIEASRSTEWTAQLIPQR